MEEILAKLESIEQRLVKIEEKCSKMSGHIDFVETVYNTISSPLFYMLGNKKIRLIKEE